MFLFADCLNKKVDIAIVVDNSESVHPENANVYTSKPFIIDIVNDSNVDSGNIRFAYSVYTHDVTNEFFLKTYSTKSNIIGHITATTGIQGGTNTGAAIQNLRENVFIPAKGDRGDADNMAIIITDGRSNYHDFTVQQADLAKQSGIHLVAVGVGLTDSSELYEIASDPAANNVFLVNSFGELFSIEDLVEDLFFENCTGMTSAWLYHKTLVVMQIALEFKTAYSLNI